jgi:16S rRNA (adenine1518-N6/adenine1519-N6)-dimethyltransferase
MTGRSRGAASRGAGPRRAARGDAGPQVPALPGALLTASSARALMDRHGLAMRRRDGQNLLVDPNTVRRIVAAAGVGPDDTVLEVGPGLGSLTLGLAPAVRRVVAVELDAGFIEILPDILAGVGHVELVHADALAVDLAALVDGGPARLVANLPYNVATPIVLIALASGAFTEAFVMVQREVGQRWAARPGDPSYAGVSARLGILADVRLEFAVPRSVFLPVPNVDSTMVRLVRRPDAPRGADAEQVGDLIDLAFAQRRKTLRNALRGVMVDDRLEDVAIAADVDLSRRAEELDPEVHLRLARAVLADAPGATGPAGAGLPGPVVRSGGAPGRRGRGTRSARGSRSLRED